MARRHPNRGLSHRLPQLLWDVLGKNMKITQFQVKEIFDYHLNGNLIWKIKKATNTNIGSVVGSENSEGYLQTSINSVKYKIHQLVFIWHFGYCPKIIDHIDQNKKNNKIENLREATNSQNSMNRPKQLNNTTGFKGVSIHKQSGKFQCSIKINNKKIWLGLFVEIKDAVAAYQKAAEKYHQQFKCV